ncbi:hypothetical protein MPSEU_000909700 [Mayamaea pseudoterrestris]|nr:hypothetical protein MPSEU_000909700 [Mayamaea pseudoterrestris]
MSDLDKDTARSGSDDSSSNLRNRGTVSKHRAQLDKLEGDASHSVAHAIPEITKKERLDTWDMAKTTITNFTKPPQSPEEWISFLFPAYRWLKVYDVKSDLSKDLIAGLTVGVMVIPQSMSYAKLAGLPVEYGLYSAFVPVFMYAIFGSSRQLAIGPVALVSLLLSSGLGRIMEKRGFVSADDDNYDMDFYINMALQASFLVGVINIGLGLLRLGFITIFLSHAVISGFISGAALIIASSQLKYLFGVKTERYDTLQGNLKTLILNLKDTNWRVVIMGFSALFMLLGIKQVARRVPRLKWIQPLGPLTVTIIAIVLTAALNLDERGIDVVGEIPKGMPPFTAGAWTPIENFGELIVPVISIVLIGFLESIAIARKFAARHKYEIEPSLELMGLGFANLFGGMFGGYPVTGSFSRSAVNNDSGAKTGLAGIVTGILVMFVLLFLTPIFEILPTAILGAIVIAGVISLVDYPEAIFLYKVHKKDFCLWVIAFLLSLLFGVEMGLAVSVGLSLVIVLYESAYPQTAILGRLPGTTVYRNVKEYQDAETFDGIVVIRVNAPLYFANAENIRDKIRKYRLAAEEKSGEDLKFLIVDLTPCSHIDVSALHVLMDMNDNYKSRNQQLCFSNPCLTVLEQFELSGLTEKVGRNYFFSSTHDAVKACLNELDVESNSTRDGKEDEASELDEEAL